MLSQRNINRINDQITDELRIVGRSFAPQQEKMEALERIAALKALMDPYQEVKPQTDRDDIAEAVVEILKNFRR